MMPARLIPFSWTPERAAAAGRLSGEARRRRAKPQPNPPDPHPTTASDRAIKAQLALVASQIERTRAVLDDERTNYCPACERGGIEPHHRAQLLKALDTLLDRQRELLGIPRTGNLRPRSPREGRERGSIPAGAPMFPAPQPPVQTALPTAPPLPSTPPGDAQPQPTVPPPGQGQTMPARPAPTQPQGISLPAQGVGAVPGVGGRIV